MPATCLDNIISIKDKCGNATRSTSGVDLFDLPGLSYQKLAAIADSEYLTGAALAADKVRLARDKIQKDLVTVLHGNGYIVNQIDHIFRSGDINEGAIIPAMNVGGWRGQVVYNKRSECTLRRLFITDIYVKSNFTGEAVLRIQDGTKNYDYDVDLTAGGIDVITVNFSSESNEIKILLPDTIPVFPVKPNCGCGSTGDECAKTLGYSAGVTNNSESFGLFADIQCRCDLDFLMCQLATISTVGDMVKFLAGALILDEALKTDRLNWFTIYGVEEAKATKVEWIAEYEEMYNDLITAMPKMIQSIDRCGCIRCNSSYIVANV